MFSLNRIYLIAGILFITAFLVLILSSDNNLLVQKRYSEAYSIGKGVQSFDELSNDFVNLAEDKGALYAFEILRRAKLPPQTDLHLLGHVVGDELYKQTGVKGIVHCTPEFRNACSHTMVIGTLNDFGEAGLGDIREACKEAPGGSGAYTMCYHGLGHGVFSHFAFKFPETVDFCNKTGTEDYFNREYIECVGGAVMELMGGGGHDPYNWEIAREEYLSLDDPLSLCLGNEIPDDTKEICLIYITPQIWESVGINLGFPDPSKFPDAFSVCDQISHDKQNLRDACFGGFGKEFIPIIGARDIRGVDNLTDEQYEIAGSWCMYANASDGRRACISETIASLFWGGENNPDASFRFCKLIRDKDVRGACWLRLASDISTFIIAEKRKNILCKQIPNEFQNVCKLNTGSDGK
jgi:hypothetical protein